MNEEITEKEIKEIEAFIGFIEESLIEINIKTNVMQYYSWAKPNRVIVCTVYEFPILTGDLLYSWLNELADRRRY